MKIRRMALLAVAPAVFGLAGCGGGGTDGDGVASAERGSGKPAASASPSRSLTPEQAQLKFAQCMRENGVDVADPGPDRKGVQITSRKGQEGAVENAMKKCQPYLQAGRPPGEREDPKIRDQMLKFAQCMRQHGIDVPDPEPGGGIKLRAQEGSEARMKAAEEACKEYGPDKGPK